MILDFTRGILYTAYGAYLQRFAKWMAILGWLFPKTGFCGKLTCVGTRQGNNGMLCNVGHTGYFYFGLTALRLSPSRAARRQSNQQAFTQHMHTTEPTDPRRAPTFSQPQCATRFSQPQCTSFSIRLHSYQYCPVQAAHSPYSASLPISSQTFAVPDCKV